MEIFDNVIEYFTEVDIEGPYLDNVFRELKGFETSIALYCSTHDKLKRLIEKATILQIDNFFTGLNLRKTINIRNGAEILEAIFRRVNELKEENIIVEKFCNFIRRDFTENFCGQNSTFVLREFFTIVGDKNLKLKLTESFKENRKEILNLKNPTDEYLLSKKSVITTVAVFIKNIDSSQKHTKKFIRRIDLENQILCRFYEEILEFADEDTIDNIFTEIENDFIHYSKHECANYFIQKFILAAPQKLPEIYKIFKPHLQDFPQNSNILLNLIVAIQRSGNHRRAHKLIVKYLSNIYEYIFKDGTINRKYAELYRNFFSAEEKYSFHAIAKFDQNFTVDWLYGKNSILVVLQYIKSGAPIEEKRRFFRLIKGEFNRMAKKEKSILILKKILNYCDRKMRDEIIFKLNSN